jgi:hypothetical protein
VTLARTSRWTRRPISCGVRLDGVVFFAAPPHRAIPRPSLDVPRRGVRCRAAPQNAEGLPWYSWPMSNTSMGYTTPWAIGETRDQSFIDMEAHH